MDAETLIREYYRTIDGEEYEELAAVLSEEFVQYRPDRSLVGRAEFLRFMREDRPNRSTIHELRDVVVDDGLAVARGRLLDGGGGELFAFVDVFEVDDGELSALETYTR